MTFFTNVTVALTVYGQWENLIHLQWKAKLGHEKHQVSMATYFHVPWPALHKNALGTAASELVLSLRGLKSSLWLHYKM